jgi:hypothetical protein
LTSNCGVRIFNSPIIIPPEVLALARSRFGGRLRASFVRRV